MSYYQWIYLIYVYNNIYIYTLTNNAIHDAAFLTISRQTESRILKNNHDNVKCPRYILLSLKLGTKP